MKPSLSLFAIVGLSAFSLAASAQTNPPAGSEASQAAAADITPAVAEPALASDGDAPLIAAVTQATDAGSPEAAAEPVTTSADTNAPSDPKAIIPLIVMDDVPLTDALRNLARQANVNYMLDPRVVYGQPGTDGKVLDPKVTIRWENVSAEQALHALLNNYSLQLVEDPKSRISRVTMKDPAAPDPLVTEIIQLRFADASNIVSSVQTTLTDKRSRVMPDFRTSQLIVLATEKEQQEVLALIERLDTQPRQVLIEARLLETSINPKTIKGLDWTGTLQAQRLRFGNNNIDGVVTDPGVILDTANGFNPSTAFLNADGVSAVFSFLNSSAEAKVLSAPRAVTLDNETAHISVTRASPIFKNTAGTQGSPGGSEVTYTNLGVKLDVTPRISANDYVDLKVVPEVSRVFETISKVVNDEVNEADVYDVRKIETHVLIPSGNTLVLGGLVQDDLREGNTKVPVLGDIPVLGYAFRSNSKSRQKSNLLVFITPTIIKEEDFQPTTTQFMQTPVPTEDTVAPDWTAFDDAKPRDWSKRRAQAEPVFSEVE